MDITQKVEAENNLTNDMMMAGLKWPKDSCSECPKRISLSYNRKTCGMDCAIKRELRLQCERREKKKDKDIFFWSYHGRNKQFTLYDCNRKSMAVFNSSGMLVTWWLGVSKGDRNKFSRINFGTKKKGSRK